MTVSADCKLRPRPPALVLNRNTKYSEAGSLNVFSSIPRSSALVVPIGQGKSILKRYEGNQKQSSYHGLCWSLTIKTQVLEVAVCKVILHDGHERGHLTEKQHFVVGGPQLGQDAIQQLKLPRSAEQVRSEGAI